MLDDDTVERVQNDTFVAKIDTVFGADHTNKIFNGVDVNATDSQIVDLATDKHAMTLVTPLIKLRPWVVDLNPWQAMTEITNFSQTAPDSG